MCLEFAKRGAIIVAWDINNEGNQTTASLVRENNGTIYTYTCDVRYVDISLAYQNNNFNDKNNRPFYQFKYIL